MMPVSSCCSKPRSRRPHAQPSFARRPAQGPATAVMVPAAQDAGFLLGQQAAWAVGLQATAGTEAAEAGGGQGLGPQARSLRGLPHPRLPGRQTLKRQPGAQVTEGGQCVCVCVWAHVGACRKVCGTQVRGPSSPPGPTGAPWTPHVDLVLGICPRGPSDSTRDVPGAPAPGARPRH